MEEPLPDVWPSPWSGVEECAGSKFTKPNGAVQTDVALAFCWSA